MKRHIKRTSLFGLVLLLTATVAARADKVDDHVKAELQKQRIPGLSLAVIKHEFGQKNGVVSRSSLADQRLDSVYKPLYFRTNARLRPNLAAVDFPANLHTRQLCSNPQESQRQSGLPATWH